LASHKHPLLLPEVYLAVVACNSNNLLQLLAYLETPSLKEQPNSLVVESSDNNNLNQLEDFSEALLLLSSQLPLHLGSSVLHSLSLRQDFLDSNQQLKLLLSVSLHLNSQQEDSLVIHKLSLPREFLASSLNQLPLQVVSSVSSLQLLALTQPLLLPSDNLNLNNKLMDFLANNLSLRVAFSVHSLPKHLLLVACSANQLLNLAKVFSASRLLHNSACLNSNNNFSVKLKLLRWI
jgi:hypothetical protein